MSSERSSLIDRDGTKFLNVNNNIEANLEHAANDVYDSIVDDVDEEELDEDAIWLREQRHLNKSLHWIKRPSLFMVGVSTFLLAFGFSCGESSRKIILFKLGCNSIIDSSNKDYCDPAETEILISNLQLYSTFISTFIAILVMTKIGQLSDQYGRKIFIFIYFVNYLLSRILKYYLMTSFDKLVFGWLVFLEALSSVTGGLMTFLSLLNCYVSDIAEIHQRSYFIGVCMAFFFTGLSLGPIAGNIILSTLKNFKNAKSISTDNLDLTNNYKTFENYEFNPLRFELLVVMLLVLFSAFVLPESRSNKARRKSRSFSVHLSRDSSTNFNNEDFEIVSRNQQQSSIKSFYDNIKQKSLSLIQPLRVLYIPLEFKPTNHSIERFQRERIAVILIAIIDSFLTGCAIGLGEIMVLYGILKLNWGAIEIGYLMAIGCAARAIVLIGISPILNHQVYHKLLKFKILKYDFDMIDFSNSFIGLIAEIIAFAGYTLSKNSKTFFVFLVISSISSLISPNLSSAVVKYYPDSKTGELFSSISLIKNIFNLTMPVLFLTIYKYSLTINFPELIFIVLLVLMTTCTVVIIVVKYLLRLTTNSQSTLLKRTSSLSRASSFSAINSNINANSSYNEPNPIANENEPSVLSNYDNKIGELHRKNSNISQYRSYAKNDK